MLTSTGESSQPTLSRTLLMRAPWMPMRKRMASSGYQIAESTCDVMILSCGLLCCFADGVEPAEPAGATRAWGASAYVGGRPATMGIGIDVIRDCTTGCRGSGWP
jgi:hypothetical protein